MLLFIRPMGDRIADVDADAAPGADGADARGALVRGVLVRRVDEGRA